MIEGVTTLDRSKEENKRLCDRYPFLLPWNRFSGKTIIEGRNGGYWLGNPNEIPEYDYEYTELDSLPDGWNKAFGEQMCEELREALIEDGDLDRWKIVELKQKYGSMRLTDNGYKHGSRVPDIIGKYESMSERTCVVCGAPATQVTIGWISPFCDECCINCAPDRSVSIEEWLKEKNDNGRKDDSGN